MCLGYLGVNERGEKRFLAIEDGVRESTQSWREVLLGLKARGMNNPKLAIGDGAVGFWAARDEVYSKTRQQRCWVHKMNNVLSRVPKAVQPKMKQSLYDIWQADIQKSAGCAFDQFAELYDAKYPKAVECLYRDRQELLAFCDFPAQHWQSIRTTNPLESTFAIEANVQKVVSPAMACCTCCSNWDNRPRKPGDANEDLIISPR